MRQKFFITPFAATGDRESPPDSQQPDGSVSYSTGFGPDYEADPATNPNAKPVPREETNGIFHDLTQAVAGLQQEGAPEFITAADNGGSPFAYSRGAMVRWSASGDPPFTTYVSRVNNNTSVPSNTVNWAPLLFEAATNAQAIAGTSTSLIVTPAALKAALDSASVSVPDATTSVKGIQRNATNAEAQAGSLNNATITPASLSSALGAYSFNASQVGSGTLAAARIPNLDAGKVTSGVFAAARIPAINISAGQVTSGTLPVARGGTGQSSLTSGNYLRGNGTGGVQTRTPEQVLSDIGALRATAPRAQGPLEIQSAGASRSVDLLLGDGTAAGGVRRTGDSLSNGLVEVWASGRAIHLRPNGQGGSSGELVVNSNGNVTVSGSVTASGGFQGSSRTVKTDEEGCPYGLDEVMALEPVSFRYLPEYRDDGDRRSLGFFAEDLARVLPELVRESDGPSPLVVEYDQLLPVLVRAIQEQTELISTLEDRITRLEARNG